jgi:hypothetical protein
MRARQTPSTPTGLLSGIQTRSQRIIPDLPHTYDIILHTLFHTFLLALCLLALVALWFRAPVAAFAIFLVWVIIFYALLFTLAWFGRPTNSLLTVALARLRANNAPQPLTPEPQSPSPAATPGHQYPFPTTGPYLHPPSHRSNTPYDALSSSHEGPRSLGSAADEYDDEDVDDETRQRNIEEEMARREVSIVTVPRRKLWITNPS